MNMDATKALNGGQQSAHLHSRDVSTQIGVC